MKVQTAILMMVAAVGVMAVNIIYRAEAGHNPAIIDQRYPTASHGNCDHYQSDLNWSCAVNSGDQLALAQYVGQSYATYTPTPGPPTNTPTNTPTATNTPQITIGEIVDDTTGDHLAALCTGDAPNGVSGYSWQFHGRIQDQTSDETEFTAWGTFQWQECEVSPANTYVYVQNLKVYAKIPTGWHFYPTQNNPDNWCRDHYPDTFTQVADCTGSSGAGWLMPQGRRSIHWAESTDTLVADDICHLVLFQAKKSGPGEVVANTGFDWRVGTASAGDSWFGQYNLLTTDWKWIGGSSCTAQQLAGAPLP